MGTEQRIEKLENELICAKRRNGTLLAGVCLLVAFLTLTWTGLSRLTPAYAQNTTPEVVRAKKFILEDENGNIRAMLAVSKSVPSLSLLNENGIPLAMLSLPKDEPVLSLRDINGKFRFVLSVSKKDGSTIKFYDENEKNRGGMMESGLFLLDENENRRAILNYRNGGSSLGLYGDGKTFAGLTVLGGDGPRLIFMDENGDRQPIK